MAIRKTAKNIIIEVKSDYNLSVGGKLEKIAEKINVEAKKENLINIYFKEDDIYKAFEALGKEDNSMDLILDLDNESEFKKIYLSNSKEKYVLDPEKIKYYPSNGNDYDPKIQTIIKD